MWRHTNSDHDRTTQSDPGIVNCQSQSANAPNAVLSLQLIPVSRCVHFLSFHHADNCFPSPFKEGHRTLLAAVIHLSLVCVRHGRRFVKWNNRVRVEDSLLTFSKISLEVKEESNATDI